MVDFRAGTAVVVSKEGESFDPDKVREFLRKSGFSIPKMELDVRGRLEKWKNMPALRVPGIAEVLVLAGGVKLEELTRQDHQNRTVRVEGLLHPVHGDKPNGLTVERFTVEESRP